MRRRKRPAKATKIEIIPMIDTMFFLLVFFLLSALNVINLESIGINLPRENSAASQPKITQVKTDLTVAIQNDGNVYVNRRLVDPAEVGQALLDAATNEERIRLKQPNAVLTEEAIRNMSVVVAAQDKVKHGLVVRCIDSARQKNIDRFAIGVDQTIAPAPAPSP